MSYEEERTMMSVRSTGRSMSALLFMDAKMMMVLWTFLKRMQQENVLKGGEVLDFEKFMKATEGKFDIMNVPGEIRKNMVQELNDMNIRYHMLPVLNEESGMRQLAVFTEDRQKFSSWYSQKIIEKLQKGGEKSPETLKRLTDNNTSIVSIPCNDLSQDVVTRMKDDFNALEINYSQLPDLHVGDGHIQFLTASADMKKVEHWFTLYKDDLLKQGIEIGGMKTLTGEQYINTSELNAEEYISTGTEEIKALNEKYEGREKGEIETALNDARAKIRSIEDTEYQKLHSNPAYEEITINKETLVDNCCYVPANDEHAKFFFASRVPGTYGDMEQTLILPSDSVFLSDNGKTYVGFLEKDKKPLILNAAGKPVSVEKRQTGSELAHSYDKVLRKFRNVDKVMPEKTVELGAGQAVKTVSEKLLSNPVL